MVLLGLLLVVLSVAAVVLLAVYNTSGGPEHSIELFGREIATANGWEIFTAGVVLTLVFFLGLWTMTAAARRRRRLRAEVRAARHDAMAAEAERDRLAQQLNEQHTATAPTAPVATQADGETDTHGRRRFFGRHHADRTPTTTGAPPPEGR